MKKKNKKKPLITIVTANLKDDLELTILSIIAQKNNDIEFIVKDAASDPMSIKILKFYNNHISKWVSKKDKGIWDGSNIGLKLGRGEYLMLLDSGDALNEGAIKTIVELIKKNPKIDVIIGSCLKSRFMHGFRPEDIYKKFSIIPSFSGSFIIRNKTLQKFGYFDLRFKGSSDYDLLFKLIKDQSINFKYAGKNNILSIKAPGGFSDKRSYFKTIIEEFRIRLNNNQNLFYIFFLLLTRSIKYFVYYLINFDGNIKSKFKPHLYTNRKINLAKKYLKKLKNKKKFIFN